MPSCLACESLFTLPKVLRRIFMQERRLLGKLTRTAYDTTRAFLAAQFPGVKGGVPYFVSSVHTFGSSANVHHHAYYLALSHPPSGPIFRESESGSSKLPPLRINFPVSRSHLMIP